MRDRYYLNAYGPMPALTWMFRDATSFEHIGDKARYTFNPAEKTHITQMRDLERVCARWQNRWSDLLAQHQAGVEPRDDDHASTVNTFGDLIDRVAEARRGEIADGTAIKDGFALKAWIREFGRGLPINSLTTSLLSETIKRWATTAAAQTVTTRVGTLKTYLNRAVDLGLINVAPHRGLRAVKLRPNPDHKPFWTAEQVTKALQIAARDKHQPTAILLVALGCHLGLRPEEIIMLRWDDLDLDATRDGEPAPVCHIVAHDGWVPKDAESRSVPISATLLAILRKHRQLDGYVLQPKVKRPRRSTSKAYRYDPIALWNRLMEATKSAGLPRLSPNGMRHSFASNALISGVPDAKIAKWLGHADTRMVFRFHGRLLSYDRDIERVAAARNGAQPAPHSGSGIGSSPPPAASAASV